MLALSLALDYRRHPNTSCHHLFTSSSLPSFILTLAMRNTQLASGGSAVAVAMKMPTMMAMPPMLNMVFTMVVMVAVHMVMVMTVMVPTNTSNPPLRSTRIYGTLQQLFSCARTCSVQKR
jgi:hypothetical protein